MICHACANQQSLLNRKPTGCSYQYYLYVHRCSLTSFIQTIDPLVTGIIAKLHNKMKHPGSAQGGKMTEKCIYETDRSGGTGHAYRDLRQPASEHTRGCSVEVDRLWWQVLLGSFLVLNRNPGQPMPTHL